MRWRRARGADGPGEDPIEGAFLAANFGVAQEQFESCGAGFANRLGRTQATSDGQGGEAALESWQESIHVFTNPAAQDGGGADEASSVSGQEFERVVVEVGGRLGEAEAVDGSAVDGGEVGVVGLVALGQRVVGTAWWRTDGQRGPQSPSRRRRRGRRGDIGRCARRRRSGRGSDAWRGPAGSDPRRPGTRVWRGRAVQVR